MSIARLENLKSQRADLEERVQRLQAEAEAAGNSGRMGRYMKLRARQRTAAYDLGIVNAEIVRLETPTFVLPSRTFSNRVPR